MLRSAVVDTSVLVSAFLFPASVPGRVVALAEKGVYTLTCLADHSRRTQSNPTQVAPYCYIDTAIDAWCAYLHKIGSVIPWPLPDIDPVCRDPDDDHIIAAAVVAEADTIVTGDRGLLALDRYQAIRMLTARAFLDEIE